ncbi:MULTISPECIES: amino acid ABC transporter permease [unclassified Streptomyces]|uniref:amino acid ABC transporter permease n=1 Tax=unclassified Streptomyces TaxID=2593676 RepID=UPI002DD85936|nr:MULTISPECIES: amino acid ABC transporter permease [unclassified Streptomyces]WSA91999.1 amino acid ABC transporter permease [Streptomyces sp. NBC_01795]WSB76366.1 amino acid ABC transporter permease [Streptomyces sp. NBC_01775]WSS15359.1 amino acid ABC transporter permease [Streptomyces sp. NBC_01186]WSS44204.1 amino acid ABC transporter permease [Streptomyces sp. NBC_01187]
MSASVLFDAPGPKARARNIVYTVVGVLALLGLVAWAGIRLYDKGQFEGELWDIFNYSGIRENILDALLSTLKVFALAGVLSLVFAVILCVARLSDHKPVRWVAVAFIDLFRSIPLLITIFALWVGIIGDMTPMWALVIGLTIYNGCVQAEVLRAGVNAVPRGQAEAAYAIGLRKTQVTASVLFPQAVRSMLPTIISQLVVTLKDTSLGFMILYPELLYSARLIANNTPVGGTYPIVQTVIVFGLIYIVLCLALAALANWIERRGRRSKAGIVPAKAKELKETVTSGP